MHSVFYCGILFEIRFFFFIGNHCSCPIFIFWDWFSRLSAGLHSTYGFTLGILRVHRVMLFIPLTWAIFFLMYIWSTCTLPVGPRPPFLSEYLFPLLSLGNLVAGCTARSPLEPPWSLLTDGPERDHLDIGLLRVELLPAADPHLAVLLHPQHLGAAEQAGAGQHP